MAPENQNEEIAKIGSEQGKLETLRTDKEAPQDLKKALQTYRKVYFDEVNTGKNELTNALSNTSLYQSKEARDYLSINVATGLSIAMTSLATEGQRIKTAKEEKKEYPTLKTLKDDVKAKLTHEKTALAEYGELENVGKKLEEISKTNSSLTDKATLANVSSTLKQKQALIKPLELIEKSLSSKSYTLATDLHTKQKDLANSINKQLASDIDDCKNVTGARDEYKEANTTLGMIETAIAKEKKPLSAKAYEQYSKELKTSLGEMNRIYSDYNVTYTTAATTGIFKEIGPNFAPKVIHPLEKRLTALITNLEKDKPKGVETKLDPDLQAQLDYEDAQKKVADMAKELADLEKLEEEVKKDPKTHLDRTDLDKFTVKIKDLQKKYDDFAKAHAIFQYATDAANPDAAGPKLKDKFVDKIGGPLRSKMDSILYRSWKRESEIKDFEKEALNKKLAEMLPKMDASWQANVNDKAGFLGAAPSDENSPEYKAHIDGESAMFAHLVACESQVNFALSKKDQLNPDNLKRFEEYQKLCSEKLKLITENRANRKMAKAAGSAQDQDHEYSVVVGTKTKIVYKRDPTDPKGRIAVEEHENVYEKRTDTYKFSDCVEFVQPSDPKYKEINGGKGWRFKKDDLPQSVKDRFELQAASIVTTARTDAETEARQEKQKIISKNNLFDKAREELGENAKEYFAALDALAKGDVPGAMALYKQYLEKAKNFSTEDKEKHASYVADAQKQVEVYAESAEFYEAMALMKDGKLDDSIGKFRTYIEKIQAKPAADQKKFSEQLEMSVEIVRKFNNAKMAMFDDLKFDLKYAHAIKIAKGLNSNADLVETLKKIEANAAAIESGKTPPFKPEEVKLNDIARDLMLPYLPYSALTEGEKQQRNLGRGGLQGVEITDLEAGVREIKKRIDKGEPINFDEEMKKLEEKLAHYGVPANSPGAPTFDAGDGRKVDTVTPHLFRLFKKINSTDADAREKGFVEIADYFKETEIGMKYTQKYLSKALVYRYEEFEQSDGGATKKEVTQKMMADPAIAADINRGAREYYKKWVAEQNSQLSKSAQIPVDPPDPFVLQSFQKQLFEQRVRYQYEREMRKKMTDKGWASDGSALEKFNTSLPYNDGSGRWYKPWSWSDYNEDDWVDFKKQATQFAVETIVTLPIGMGAGAIGRAVGKGMLTMLMKQGLKAEAIVLLEEGGIMALRANAAVWEGVSPALKTAIMAQRGRIMAGYAVGLMAEGGAMLVMNSVWEGLQSGRQPEFFRMLDAKDWKHVSLKLVESIGKAGAFRAFGAGQQKILQGLGGAEAGALQKAGAIFASEAFSGFAGTGLEALTLIAQGQGNQVTFDFWARGIIQNALQSYGTHKIHGAGGEKAKPTDKKLEAKFKGAESELIVSRLAEKGIKAPADIHEVIPLPDGGLIVNGQRIDPVLTPVAKMPKEIQTAINEKAHEFRKEKTRENLDAAGIKEPADMVAVREGKVYNKEGKEVPITDPSLLPEALKARYEELRRADVKQKAQDLIALRVKISRKEELEKDPEHNADELAKIKAELEAKAKEMGTTLDKLADHVDQQMRVFVALDALYSSERQLYTESKVVKKPVLDENGVPKLGPDKQPLYEDVNLFQHYESKTSAYSADLLHGLSHEALVAAGGCKIIKIGGDELVVYHAGPDGKIQKLFIDISNMGPTNDTATNLSGSRVNLVDIFLYKISLKIKAESAANQGKALDGAKFNKEIADVANQLFNLDRTPEGYRVPAPDAEARFNKLKQEWGLDGDYAKYRTDMDSMRILAEYRSDTRGLDASYKGKKDITFSQHIGNEIQALTGMTIPDLQKLIAANPEQFKALFDQRLPKSSKLKAQSVEALMAEIAKLDPSTSKPEDLMMLYSLMARIDTTVLANHPTLKPLADKLSTTRSEMVGEPAHTRVEAPRLMDAKVVSIDLPPDVAAALRKLADTNPTEAHAILTAARTLAEKPLDQLKYKKTEGFAEFNILDHIEVKNGKIVIKKDAKEFREAYEINLKDKKVANIVAIEGSLAKARATLEGLQSKMEKGQIDKPTYEAEMRKVEAEINRLEDRMSTDPDTGAYSQAYLDCKPSRMFTFPDGQVPLQYRTWNSVVTELSHAGVINSKYGYLGMDTIMKAYHDVLKAEISAQLPANLQHFKIIRSGGGKFEIVFLDARAVAHLQQKGLTTHTLVEKISSTSGQKAVDKILSADPAAIEKSKTDAAVRNSQFKYNKGTEELEVGKLTVAKEQKPIKPAELAIVQRDLPKASARELIAEVMRRRALAEQPGQPAAKAESQVLDKVDSTELPPGTRGTDKLFYSSFDSVVPKELPPNSEGWIGKDGRIHYNIDHLNKVLSPGHEIVIVEGQFRIKSPTGDLLTLKGYEKAMKGTEYAGKLINEMKTIKNHESTHQTLEFGFTKTEQTPEGPKRVEDPAKTKPILDLFAEPDAFGKVPAGKIPLTDVHGKPKKVTWENVQEYLCHVGDGSIASTPSRIALFENRISIQIPNFSFQKVRTISTKLLASNPAEAFARENIAPKEGEPVPAHQGKPWTKITGSDQFNEVLKSEKGQESNFNIAHQMLMDFMWVVRTGDKSQIEAFKDSHQTFVDKKIFDKLEKELPAIVKGLSEAMSTVEGLQSLQKLEASGKLSPATREIYKRLALEANLVSDLVSPNGKDNKPKSPEKRQADLQELANQLDFGGIEVNRLIIERLSRHPDGLIILSERPNGMEVIKESLQSNGGLRFEQLPPRVQEIIRSEAIAAVSDKVTKGKQSIDKKVAELQKELDDKEAVGDYDDILSAKLEHAKELQKVYESLNLADPAKAAELIKKMEAQKQPKGYESSPSPADIFYANYDKLSPDFLAKILDGKVKYETVDGPGGKRNTAYIEGRNLGIGGLGEVWSTVVFDGRSRQPREMVIKKPKNNFELEHSINDFDSLSPSDQLKLKNIFAKFQREGVKHPDGYGEARAEAQAILHGGRELAQFDSLLQRYRAAHQEAENAKLVMDHQSKGRLKGFTAIEYVTAHGKIMMESIANPKANYAVCDYDKIIKGEITTVDGKNPITQEGFWGGMADIFTQLGEAHSLGMVHRDLKPENFGIGPDGKIRLIDVGSIRTKDNIKEINYYEFAPDAVQMQFGAHPNTFFKPNEPSYFIPEQGGVTLGYYKGDKGYKKEATGEPGPDGKPEYSLGYSDRVAMAQVLRELVDAQKSPTPGHPEWVKPNQVAPLEKLIEYLEGPRADINEAATRLRQIMGIK